MNPKQEKLFAVGICDTCPANCDGYLSWLQPFGYTITVFRDTETIRGSLISGEDIADTLALFCKFDLFIVGPCVPTSEAFFICRSIKQYVPKPLALVVVSRHADDLLFQSDAAHVGVSAYLEMSTTRERFCEVVNATLAGSTFISQNVLLNSRLFMELGESEKLVLSLISKGKTDREIASELGKSYHTIRTQTRTILEKLQVNTREMAVRRAHHRGLI